MTRLGPGPALEKAVQTGKDAYDKWESAQRSKECRDRDGRPLVKPYSLLSGNHERWTDRWIQLMRDHKKRCVGCGGADGQLQAQDTSPDDSR